MTPEAQNLQDLFAQAIDEFEKGPHEPTSEAERQAMKSRAFAMAMASFDTADHCREHYSEDVPRLLAESAASLARAEAAETKLATIRAMATRGVPRVINLEAIDRILAD